MPVHKRPPTAGPGRRWTIGRVANDVLIAAFIATLTLSLLEPPVRGMCGHTPGRDAATITGVLLLARPAWWLLKSWNDAAERWLGLPNRPEP